MCRAHDLGSYALSQGPNQVRGQNRVSAITQNLLNLTKLYRKIEQVCRAQGQGQGHVRGQIKPQIVLLINY